MNKKIVFLATPISAFPEKKEYENYRTNIMNLVKILKLNCNVYSEIEHVSNENDYDSPVISANNDLKKIDECDIFIFHHPAKMQSSTLFELGYAFAMKKDIIIISNKNDLPYLCKGLIEHNNVCFIPNSIINIQTINLINRFITDLS